MTGALIFSVAIFASGNGVAIEDAAQNGGLQNSSYELGSICIDSPWAFNSLGKNVAAVFMRVNAQPGFSDRLLEAHSQSASNVMIHNIIVKNGIMLMEEAEADSLEFDSDTPLTLKPHGLHIMLLGLDHALDSHSNLELNLEFEKSGTIKVDVEVRELTQGAAEHSSACD